MTSPSTIELRVPTELDAVRLDRVLGELIPDHSRGRLRELVEDGRVQVNGEVVKRPATNVEAGQLLTVDMIFRDRTRPGSLPGSELDLLHEDEHLLVLVKPAGMVVHPSSVVRGGTLSELVEERWGRLPELSGNHRPGIVHRLDADTSGVIVVARTQACGENLMQQFRERTVEKRYLALVHGDPRFDSEWIDAPLGRHPRHPDRVAVLRSEGGKAAETYYEVLERFGILAVLGCKPTTGRTHQIRVHLSSVGLPVIGDRVYTSRKSVVAPWPDELPQMTRHALHAQRLAFTHPATGERVQYESEMPADMRELCELLRKS